MCAVAAGSWGFVGRPASECGILCRGDGGSWTGRPPSDGANVGFAPTSSSVGAGSG